MYRTVINEAIDEWEKYTCLRLNESDDTRNRIIFVNGAICASGVGGPQILKLSSECRTKGVIAHEIGHAIGWVFEHMRPNRDDYIIVNWSKLPGRYRHNMYTYTSGRLNTYGIPYDYTSLMHYGQGHIEGLIEARDTSFQSKLSQREGLSFKDINLANFMYDCAKNIHCSEVDCDDGFQLYKSFKGEDKCQCWCDSGDLDDPLVLCSERKREPPEPDIILSPPNTQPPMECMDMRPYCKEIKSQGKCMTKMEMMMANCAKTCNFCGKVKDLCMDYEVGCGLMAGHCKDPGLKSTMSEVCMKSCGLFSSPPGLLRNHE